MPRQAASPTTRSVVRRRLVVGLTAGQLISATGSQMTWLALPWFVLTTSGSPLQAGAVLAAEMLPIGLLGVPSGAVVARFGARRTLLLCDAARVPLLLAIPLLAGAGVLSLPVLLVLVFAIGVFFAPYYAAQRVAIADAAGADERRVGVSNALVQGANRLPVLAGAGLGGVLIGVFGPLAMLYVNAATFLVALGLVAWSVPAAPATDRAEHRPEPVLAGVRAIAREPLLRALVLTGVCTEMAFQALQVALPLLVITHYGGDVARTGLLLGGWGGGAALGCVLAALAALRIPARVQVRWSAPVQSLPLWVLPFTVDFPVAVVALVLSGLANGLAVAPKVTLLSVGVTETVRAHVMSAYITVLTLAGPPGALLAGGGFSAFGVTPVLTAIAAVSTVGAAGLFVACRVRGPASSRSGPRLAVREENG